MTVLDILKTASIYLNLDDKLSLIFERSQSDLNNLSEENVLEENGDSESILEEDEKIFSKLLTSFNEMVGYIYAYHFDLTDTRDITFDENGNFQVSDLPYTLKNILSIVYRGERVKFQNLGNIIHSIPSTCATLTYTFLPEEMTENDDFDFLQRVDIGTLALGVAWFYSLNCAIYDDAENFKEQFLENISKISPKKIRHLPQRRWE